jgi:hypothetical protein
MLNVMATNLGDMTTIIKMNETVNLSKQLQQHVGDAACVGCCG